MNHRAVIHQTLENCFLLFRGKQVISKKIFDTTLKSMKFQGKITREGEGIWYIE